MTSLVVTCDEPPVPPLHGNNRKVHDVLKALLGHYDLHMVVYPRSRGEAALLQEYWSGPGVTLHLLERRRGGRHVRALASQLTLPTVTRDFGAECDIVRRCLGRQPDTKVLIDLISGSPLCCYLSGALVSGHDCMSHFWSEMARWSPTLPVRFKAMVRSRFSLQAERRFYHLAHRVHVVSRLDEQELLKINPAARYFVIPLGGKLADERNLLAPAERKDGLIWGNLAFPPIAQGLKRFLVAAGKARLRLPGWRIIGGLPKAAALERFPELEQMGLQYFDRVADVEKLLGSVRYVLLPDTAGAGRKFRSLDSLNHACCVVGLAEVFRDLPGRSGHSFVQFDSPEQMAGSWSDLLKLDADAIGRAGREVFRENYTLETLGARWREVIAEMPPVTFRA